MVKRVLMSVWDASLRRIRGGSTKRFAHQAAGNRMLAEAFAGTTVQNERFQATQVQKMFEFVGRVSDVKSSGVVVIELLPRHLANVRFLLDMTDLKKHEEIRFRGTLTVFGTGVVIHHRITKAMLV